MQEFQKNGFPGIISQPKAEIILKSYGLNSIKARFYNRYEQDVEDQNDGKSRLGTAVFDNLIIKRPEYSIKVASDNSAVLADNVTYETKQVVLDGNTTIGVSGTQQANTTIAETNLSGGSNAFRIDTVLIEVSQQRNIITTLIAGGNGTVKEYIGDGDYQIKMRGFLETDSPGKYPKRDVTILTNYLKAPVPLEVVSGFLRLFNIYKIVVTDYNFPQTEGRRNLQFFEITAISETELEKGLIIDTK